LGERRGSLATKLAKLYAVSYEAIIKRLFGLKAQ